MLHPSAKAALDLTPIQVGEVWENPVTGERAKIVELPWHNPEGRGVAELTALVGSRVPGEHRHPNMVERFTVLQGELTVRYNGKTSVLQEGQTKEVRPGHWHDWWNASNQDALVRVEVTPSERFMHMIETLFGLAQLGYTNDKGIPIRCSRRCSAGIFPTLFNFVHHNLRSSEPCSPHSGRWLTRWDTAPPTRSYPAR